MRGINGGGRELSRWLSCDLFCAVGRVQGTLARFIDCAILGGLDFLLFDSFETISKKTRSYCRGFGGESLSLSIAFRSIGVRIGEMNVLKGLGLATIIAIMVPQASFAVENPLFGYTHLLPSPFTMPAGKLAVGTEAAFGVTDFLQVGTSIIRDIYQVYNVNAKLSILDFKDFAFGLTAEYETYNLKDQAVGNPDLQISSWLPGAVASYELLPQLALFAGGTLNFSQAILNVSGTQTSGFVQGARGESDISWAYNPHKKGVGNVLSAGATYDFTYQIYGLGISHHWRGLHLGVHYYPNATLYKLQPMISGGTVIDL